MISSTLLQTFPASCQADARMLRTRFGQADTYVGCCVTGIVHGRPVFDQAGEQKLDALFERAGHVKVVVFGSAFECPIRFHQELQQVPADTALCFAFGDAAALEEALPLLRPQYTGGVLERCGSLEGVGVAELVAARAA